MASRSAGVLLHRRVGGELQVLLVHPGGPLWARKDAGAWSIPKGEFGDDETPEAAARREVEEELGLRLSGPLTLLGDVVQRAGKRVTAFAAEADFDPDTLVSAAFEMEWPPRSGRRQSFPEVDRAAWMRIAEARGKIIGAQATLLDRLAALLKGDGGNGGE